MESLYLLVPLGYLVVFSAALVLARAAHGGQFDHLDQIQRQMPDDEPLDATETRR